MANEVSIPKALSGIEVLEAVLFDIRKALANDDRLSGHCAYNGFRATIQVSISTHLGFLPPVDRVIVSEGGEQVDLAPAVDLEIDIPVKPPNAVREATHQPLPVLVSDGNGRSYEKLIPYSDRPKQPPTARPNNIVKGA